MIDLLLKLTVGVVAFALALCSLLFSSILVWTYRNTYGFFAKKECGQLKNNLRTVLGLSDTTSIGSSFVNQVLTHQITSSLHGIQELFLGCRVQIDNLPAFQEFLKPYRDPKRPVIIISAHLGCWELVAKYSQKLLEKPLSVLAKPGKYKFLTTILGELRRRAGVRVLWNDSKALLRDMLTVLRNGEALGFVMDQKPQNRVGYRTSFLGFPADFVVGPATVALKVSSPVVGVYLLRKFGRVYTFRYDVIWDGVEHISEQDLLERMIRSMEQSVKLYPEQWTWNYKRWKFADSAGAQ